MLAHARQFTERTGKPYIIQSLVGDNAYAARNLYTYLLAQNAVFFPSPREIRLQTPEAARIVDFFRAITASGTSTLNQDTPAAIATFKNGEGGIYPTGTWMIGEFEAAAKDPAAPLYQGYAVYPYPRLWGEEVAYVSGHAWVVPKRERTPEQRTAIARFFRFVAEHNFDWARTGHLPALKAVVDSPASKRSRTARGLQRWQPPGGHSPAACNARMRSRGWSARKSPPPSTGRRRRGRRLTTPNGGSTSCSHRCLEATLIFYVRFI
jgi:multiple sugar transport system substrate-binding protein